MSLPASMSLVEICPGTYSRLPLATLNVLKAAVKSAYPRAPEGYRTRQYITLACQPQAARQFIERVRRALA